MDLIWQSCRATFDGAELVVANALVERRWRVDRGRLYPTSLRDLLAGREWLTGPSPLAAPTPAGGDDDDEPCEWHVEMVADRALPVEEPALRVTLTASQARATVVYHFEVFEHAAGVALRVDTSLATAAQTGEPANAEAAVTGVELADQAQARAALADADVMEYLLPAATHLRLTQVSLYDQTDIRNELVFENEWLLHTNEREIALDGCLFIVEETLTGDGLILLKEAPLPHVRPVPGDRDLRVRPAGAGYSVSLCGHGAAPAGGEGYRFVTLAYRGGRVGRTAALHGYQRCRRRYEPGRDGLFLSNTWGDRNRDGRICESFMREEIEAGAALGVDVIQIDDGWQRGTTANSVVPGGVWEGFHDADPHYWEPHPQRFPHGLEPVITEARSRGLRFGLWFSPDAADDYVNWELDAARLLDLHQRLGVECFKIDGVKARTKLGEARLRDFFARVLTASAGRVVFDLDVTAEVRPGYFGRPEVGPLFIENRYTDFHRYWPHQTLRNLWKLARYIDPVRLRMEFLNNARHMDKYADDPLGPHAYSPSYLFATTMMASPLGWFELSNLPRTYSGELPALVRVWREHRDRMHGGCIQPVGDCPDGTAWTGFVSVGTTGGGYALVFRELNDRPEASFDLSAFGQRPTRAEVLAGEGRAWCADGRLVVALRQPLRFALVALG
ncbi:MAG: alpha-galactosidase [Armatimonadetes bacterium]|nr:alpha-galactosidase [Armatimonadota bacterium]